MATAISEEIRGLQEVQRKAEQTISDLKGEPFLQAMRDSTLYVQRDARINAPVDTGRLRSSITPEVRAFGGSIQGVVGSNLAYAPWVELGSDPHWPPLAALEVWASRHGTSAYVVARAIARRGTKAHKFLQNAFESNLEKIKERLGSAVSGIVQKFK